MGGSVFHSRSRLRNGGDPRCQSFLIHHQLPTGISTINVIVEGACVEVPLRAVKRTRSTISRGEWHTKLLDGLHLHHPSALFRDQMNKNVESEIDPLSPSAHSDMRLASPVDDARLSEPMSDTASTMGLYLDRLPFLVFS